MRKIMKRAFAAVIVAVMLLTSMPMNGFSDFNWEGLFGVKASAAKVEKSDLPEDFDLKVYMADVLFRTEGQGYCMTKIKKDDGSEVFCTAHQYDRFLSLINDFQSPATTVYNAFYEDKKFVNSAEAWEAIRKTANPSNAISDLNLQQQYESLIYAVLFDSLCDEKLQKASYSNAITNVTSFTDKLIDKPRTAVMFEKTSLDLDASDELKDTALAFLSNGRDDKWASILEYNGMVAKYSGIIDKILKSATDIYNYINKISMYRALADVGADAVRVLIDMKNATSDEILKSALQSVIDSMSNDWFGIVDKVIFDVGFSVNMKAVKSLVDYGWKGCCEICPFLKGMAIGEAVGTAACNLLFATEDTIRQYEYMKMIVALENVSRPILKKYENAVKSNNNSSNAAAFWFTVDFISSLYATSANAANEMADICLNKGFVNYLIKICGGNNSERVEECKRTSSALLRNVTYNQKLIETVWENHIAEDYPQFFEKSNEEPIYLPSKTVKSISVSPKTVYCKVGEYPSLPNITTDPADAECTYGFKSDNQDIFRDGTVFSVSQYYPAKIVGEANITVYSLEDSSVRDTFKLIVVSSDEEPDKPENTNTESGTCGNGVSFVLYKDTGTLYISGNGNIYDGKYSSSDSKYHANAAWDKSKKFIKRVIIAKGVTAIGAYAFNGCTNLASITIPNSVTNIGGAAFCGCTSLTSITIPDSVTSVGDGAFSGCTSLTSVTIPNSVICIGNSTFNGCTGLTNLTIPNSVTSIGSSAFYGCSGLINVTIGNGVTSLSGFAFSGNKNLKRVIIGNSVISIYDYAFKGCTGLTSVTIPNSVTSIGNSAFNGCTGLTNLTIPNSVTSIGSSAFYGCTGLTSVTIPNSVTRIGDSAFNGCTDLTNLTIPNSVTSIGSSAFYGCSGLINVTIGNGVTTLSGFAFSGNKNLKSVIIGNSVKGIGKDIFRGCTGLTSMSIGESVESIGDYAFNGCTGLTNLTIPNSVTSIGSSAFYGCSGLINVTIGNGVTTLSGFAFSGNKNLKSVIIGNSVISIYDYAFQGCTGLTSVTIPNSVTSIGNSAFNGCTGLASITIPDSVTSIEDGAFYDCTGLKKVNIIDISSWCDISFSGVSANPLYYAHNLYINDEIIADLVIPDSVTSIGSYTFYGCTGLTSVTIPDSVTIIGEWAFEDCPGLTSVTIGNGVTTLSGFDFSDNENLKRVIIGNSVISIDGHAFKGCTGLTSITIPDSVISIDGYAFQDCSGLTSIVIPDSVASIGYGAFKGCTGLTSVTIGNGVTTLSGFDFSGNKNLKSVIIGNSVTSIGDFAFSDCTGLIRISIGNSVESIGAYAFDGCTGLTSITIPGSVTSIEMGAFDNCTGLNKVNITDISSWCNITFSYGLSNPLYYAHNLYINDEIITDLIIPDGVTSIGDWAFRDCTGLTSVIIPNSVTSIGYWAFNGCTGLTSVTIGNGITTLSGFSFRGNTNLKSVIIGNSVKSIDDYAFYDCTGLTSISIGESVESIGNYAFDGCTDLTSIAIPDSVTSIGYWAFNGCTGLKKVNTTDISSWCNISFSNGGSNPLYYAHSLYINDERITDLIIPDNVASIGGSAFYGYTSLVSIDIPDSVTRIDDYAFYDCTGLTSIAIPDSVTGIGNHAFDGCTSLASIDIPKSVTSIGDYTFWECRSLASITIPDSVKTISHGAFNECAGLVSIKIPNSVTSIGGSAFGGCTSLDDVYYSGSEEEWRKISIEDYNDHLLNATIHYNRGNGEEHKHTLNHIVVPSTCKVAGMEYDICSECGETFNEKTLPLAAHTWSEWTVVKEATTTAEGQEKRTCSVCGEVETRAIEKLKALIDEKTGVEIVYNDEYDSGTQIKVEEKFDGDSFQLVNSAYGEVKTSIFDIATYKNGTKVQPNGEITVRIPLPAGYSNKVFVCYVDSTNGKVTKIPCEVKDGYVIFKTNHFSEYAIVEQSANVKSVSVSDIKLNYKKSTTITPSITADDGAKYTVKYSSSNTKVATVDENGKVYAAKKGSATITCTVTDSNGNTVQDTCKVTVKYSFGQWLIKILLFGWIWY